MPMIETINLTKKYGDLVALNNLNLAIDDGDCFGFIGPNGAGKTTTIKILATLLKPTWGEARIDGKVIGYQNPLIRPIMGYVPDFMGAYDDMVVQEYLEFFAACYNIHGEAAGAGRPRRAGSHRPELQGERGGQRAEPGHGPASVDRPRAAARPQGAAARRAGVGSRPAGPHRDPRAAQGAAAHGQDDRDQLAHPSRARGAVQHGRHHRAGPSSCSPARSTTSCRRRAWGRSCTSSSTTRSRRPRVC